MLTEICLIFSSKQKIVLQFLNEFSFNNPHLLMELFDLNALILKFTQTLHVRQISKSN